MRFAAVLLVAIACSGVFASEPGQPATTDATTPPASAQPKEKPEVRQAEDSDFVRVAPKEWSSPITFDMPATWLQTLSVNRSRTINDLPVFYCDGVTFAKLVMTRRFNWGKNAWFYAWVTLEARAGHDKSVELEFTLISGTRKLSLCRVQNENVDEGKLSSHGCEYSISKADLVAFTADDASPQLRITMAIHN